MEQDKKNYHHNYYVTHYKDIIKDKKIFCESCKIEVSAWNIYKHRQSKKHAFNSLTEDEQKILISDKMALKIKKQIENLENSLAKIQ